jgi:hypothetical protein
MVTRPIERREENTMASRASLILLLTATLTASGLAAAHGGPEPERAQPWVGGGAAAFGEGGVVPVGEYRRHHRHHPYYRRDRYPYSYYQPYPQPGYAAPHWRPVPPGYYPYQPAYEPRPYYGPPRHW